MRRIDIDHYFMKIAFVVAERSTCLRHHVGAVAVKDKYILATGYNGAPTGMEDCLTLGCKREGIPSGVQTELCRAVHAEMNVVSQAALRGVSIKGATIYCTHALCIPCAKVLINTKILKLVYSINYVDKSDEDPVALMLINAGILVIMLDVPQLIIERKD